MSSKGGSGKTTLALSIADLLYRCEVRTLLVDCDLSTNGATYFYESRLADRSIDEGSELSSFNDLLAAATFEDKLHTLKINSNLEFIPSISGISEQYITRGVTLFSGISGVQLQDFIDWARLNYDIILFDWKSILSSPINLSTICLFASILTSSTESAISISFFSVSWLIFFNKF